MKKGIRISIIYCLILHGSTFSQSWIEKLTDPTSNYYEICKLYRVWKDSVDIENNKNFIDKPSSIEGNELIKEMQEEAEEYFQYWSINSRELYDSNGKMISPEGYQNQVNKIRKINGNQNFAQTQGQWVARGPFEIRSSYGNTKGIGRVFPFAVSLVDTNLIFAGTPSGGLWRSVDRGSNWQCLNDSTAGLYITGVFADPVDQNIWYISIYGSLYKTTDGGNSWISLQLQGNPGYPAQFFICTANNQILYSLDKDFKLTKSIDGGLSWSIRNPSPPNRIALKIGSDSILYALSPPYFLRSTNGGITFDTTANLGMAYTPVYIALTPADSQYIYVCSSSSGGQISLSTDGGDTFITQPTTSSVWRNVILPRFAVSNTDKSLVIAGAEVLARSTDSGFSWNQICKYGYDTLPGLPYVHPDHQWIQFAGSAYWDGNDGGLYMSDDSGVSFTDKTSGLNVSHLVSLACSEIDTSVFVSGAWDNSCIIHTDSGWANIFVGDGFDVAIHPTNKLNIFGKNQYNYFQSKDGGLSKQSAAYFSGLSESLIAYRTGFPIRFNHQNPNSMYLKVNDVWKSTNGGDSLINMSNGQIPSDNYNFLYVSDTDSNIIFTSKARTFDNGQHWSNTSKYILAVDPDESNKLWGYDALSTWPFDLPKNIYFSQDTGNSWTLIPSLDLGGLNSSVTMVCANNSNDGVYLFNSYSIQYYDNTLSNWQPFHNNLPFVKVSEAKLLSTGNKLRIATQGRGVWESDLFLSNQPLITDFISNRDTICPGDTINFYDNSLNSGPGYGSVYSWSFPGGTPSSSSDPYPKIIYNISGVYDVSLRIQNLNGLDSVTKLSKIIVSIPPLKPLPYYENFEASTFPLDWNWGHVSEKTNWYHQNYYGGYSRSSGAMMYYSGINDSENSDFITSPLFDFSLITDPVLSFDYYYAFDYLQPDTLKIFYTTDCGFSRNYLYTKGGLDLKTDSVGNYAISPDSSNWKTDILALYSLIAVGEAQLGFEFFKEKRSDLILDNINIFSLAGVGLEPISLIKSDLFIYPNPTMNQIEVIWRSSQEQVVATLSIFSITGKLLSQQKIYSGSNANVSLERAGIYFLELQNGSECIYRKVVKLD